MSTSAASAWTICYKPQKGAATRLFCLPYAGGGASIYRLWGSGLPVEELAVWADTIPYELLCGISQRVAVTLL